VAERPLPKVGWGAIVGAGAAAVKARGIGAMTLEDLAADLGVDTAAVSYWFADPGQVLVAVMEIRMNWFLDEARARMSPLPTQSERLREFLELSAADHDATYWIELWRLSSRDEPARRSRQALADAYRRTIAGIIRAGQRTGEFGTASPDKVALILATLTNGLAVSATLGDREVSPESMLDALLDTAERLLSVKLDPRAALEP